MPIYEYECSSCHATVEAIQSISEKPLVACPDCAGSLKKLVSMSSFQLKGGGWYADGYTSNSSSSKSASTGKGNGNGSGKKSDKAAASTSKKSESTSSSSKKSCGAAT